MFSAFRSDAKRTKHNLLEQMIDHIEQAKISIIDLKRPVDTSTLETDTFQDLLLKIGSHAEELIALIEVRLDETSLGLLKAFRASNRELRRRGNSALSLPDMINNLRMSYVAPKEYSTLRVRLTFLYKQ